MQMRSLFILMLLVGFALSVGCTKPPTALYNVPLCDCSFDQENPRGLCRGGYVCDAHALCVVSNGQSDKCVPEEGN